EQRLPELIAELEPAVRAMPNVVGYRVGLAMAYLLAGQREAGRAEFEALAADDFAAVPHGLLWFSAIAGLGEVCAALGDAYRAARRYALLLPFRHRFVLVGNAVCWGSAERFLGLLAETLGDHAAAREHFELAVERNRAAGLGYRAEQAASRLR